MMPLPDRLLAAADGALRTLLAPPHAARANPAQAVEPRTVLTEY